MSLNVPKPGDIFYPSSKKVPPWGPYTEKSAMFQKFTTLAAANPSLVVVEKVGSGYPKAGSSVGWDIVIFKVGNPEGGKVVWDSCIHGNEDFGVEALYALYKWLLTPNSSPAQEARRTRILERNCVIFLPFIDWRWARTTYHVAPCSGIDDDNSTIGYNIARNFKTGNEKTCSTNNYGGVPLSEPETQAMIAVWTKYGDLTKGWFYVNLHMGLSSRSSGGSAYVGKSAADVESLRRNTIYPELFGKAPEWTIRTSGVGYAPGEAVAYYGAAAAWMIEMRHTSGEDGSSSAWYRGKNDYVNLTTGAWHRELLALLCAQCALIEGEGSQTHTLTVKIGAGNGSVTPSVGEHESPVGTEVRLEATPAITHLFSRWIIDGTNHFSPVVDVEMTANHVAEARFYRPKITLTAQDGGTTNPVPGAHVVDNGSTQRLRAIPAAGYKFDHWTVAGTGIETANPLDITVTKDVTVEAVFSPSGFTVTVDSNPQGIQLIQPPYTTPFTMAVEAGETITLEFPKNG